MFRRTKNNSDITLFCFSPAVMIATAMIEISLLVWLLLRRTTSPLFKLILLTLFCLASFQFAEYHTCVIGENLFIVRLGMVAITFLPALGWHMVGVLRGNTRSVAFSYVVATILAILYLVVSSSIVSAQCTGNYMILGGHKWIGHSFGLYYYVYLFAALISGFRYLRTSKDIMRRRAMQWLMVGYISFMLPMAIVYLMGGAPVAGVPSVMCGFAVILAIILTFNVAPIAQAIKD